MFSASANSSSSTLAPKKAPKNYEAAFGALSSSYGYSAGVPRLPYSSPATTSPATTSPDRSAPSATRADAPTRAPAPHSAPKNYEAAFGALSSSYGYGAGVPALPPKSSASTKRAAAPPNVETQKSDSKEKDYSTAFASLASTYGFGGPLPTAASKPGKI
ncbi:hypothetical protein H0H81_010922 [Sphagnurus paluster]|uniref:Uncharacterized protein n=1 Tax=Sphagnurus paluster TaxID=117069 RepID=A0A9P7G1D3_9AGAR|nr:hypothetical protein H0H81_010922 [Sphagnurus paluster]